MGASPKTLKDAYIGEALGLVGEGGSKIVLTRLVLWQTFAVDTADLTMVMLLK